MNYAESEAKTAVGMGLSGQIHQVNPTLRENIASKIKFYEDEILRLRKIEEQIPERMLDMNLRDLREAMNF